MLNKIVLMGRLTRDPELRRTQGGVAVASFTLAVDRDYADKGSGQRAADFIDIEAWRGVADFAAKYFRKGQMAAVVGRLQIQDWTDREGNKRRSAKVVTEAIYFGEPRRTAPERETAESTYGTGGGVPGFEEMPNDDGEVPF